MSEPGLNPVAPTSAAILVVEDDPDTAALLQGSLAKLGGPVQVVATAAEAAEALALAVPLLIVLDLVLPDADGRTLLAAWRSTPATATVPVIVLTARGTAEVGNQCRALGVSDFLEKPVDPAAVADVARRLLSGAAAVDADIYPLTGVASRACVVSGETEVEVPEITVLLADDDDIVAVIVRTALEAQGMVVERYGDGEAALEAAQQKPIGLFLLDVNMPKMDGFELLARLRADPAYARVPVAMLTSAGDEESVERAMALGADDYLVKPLSSHELIARVQQLLTRWVERRLHELQGSELYMRGIDLMHQVFDKVRAEEPLPVRDLSILILRIVEDLKTRPGKLVGQVMNPVVLHGEYLAQHSLNTAILAAIVGQEVDIDGDGLDRLCVAAMLHEVGCVRLPDGLLQKTGDLAEEERKLLERRPELSHEIITKLAPEYAEAAEIALQVHERPDGTGYPKGLSGDQISLEAQILGAVEVFEALTHARPYRDSFQTASEAVKYLLDSSGPRFLDRVLKALIAKIGLYPVGSYVELSTDEVALVLEHRESNPMRPLLAVVTDRSGKLLKTPRITDPMLNPQINIRSSVAPPEIRAGLSASRQ